MPPSLPPRLHEADAGASLRNAGHNVTRGTETGEKKRDERERERRRRDSLHDIIKRAKTPVSLDKSQRRRTACYRRAGNFYNEATRYQRNPFTRARKIMRAAIKPDAAARVISADAN